ncbi:MAG: hypothetical protein NTW13_03030, partial [Candidatus Omnitrophica bacterium]|nr:hypothetical protein [Candidatus Omnitrophota bacterium]
MVYDRQLSEWHPGGGDWSKFFGQEGVSRKGFSADAVEKVRTILTDGRYRPEPSEAAGFSLEDIRAGAERVLEKDELVSFKFLETIDKLERILPYLYEMVRKIITEDLLKYDKIIILGRDAEIFYDALKAVLIGRPEAEKITLLPASKNFLINLNSRTTKQDREEFLTSHGLNEGTLKNGKTLLIDTGYVGSAGQLLIEVMQRLYMISDIWQRVHIKLVAIYPGATGVVPANLVINQMILTDPGEDTLNKEFPKSNRPRIVRGVNFTVADAIQALPHFYHRPYALERSSDGKLVVISSPVLDDMTSDIDRPNDVNVDNDNPVLAMIIQRRVVEYFNARRQELLATPAVASAPAAQPAGQAQKDKKTNLIHVMAGTEELPDDYKARFARAINETPAQYLDRLRNSEYEIEVIIADNPRQLKEYAEMVGFRDDVGNAFGYNNNGQAQVYVLKGHERDANVMSHEAIEAMGRQAIDDVDSAGAETGEENRLSPSASNQELLESAHSLAEFLVSEYPQVAEDGSLNYYIAGSLGVMLLLQAENIEVLEEGALPSISVRQIIPVTSSVRSSLTQFIRQIGDFDYVPLEQYRKIPLRQNNRLAKGGNERLQFAKMPEKVRRAFKKTDSRSMMSDPLTTLAYNPVRVIINGREFYITSPLVLAGYKFLHLLNNKVFDKPEKLTSDLKILLEAAGELHSRKEIIEFIHNILINYNLPYPNSEVAFFNHLSLKGQIEKLYKEVINSDPNAPYLESLSWVKERYSGILKVLQRLKNPDSKAKLVAFLNRNRKHIDIWFAPAESRNLGLIADLILESEDLRREIEIGSPGTLKDLVLNKASLLEFLKRNPWIWYKYSDRLPKESLDYLPGRSELLDILMEIEENNIDEELSVLGKIFRPDKVEYELRNVLKMRDGGDVRLRRQIVHMMAEGLAKLDREALIRLADALSNQIVRHSDKAIGGTLVAISLEEKKTYLDKVRKDFGLEVAYTSVPTAQPVGAQTDRGAFDLDKELNGLGLNSEVIYALNVAQENGGYLYHAGVEGIAARGSETGDFNQGYPLKPEPGKLIKARSFSVAVSSGYVGDALNDPYKASSLYYWDRGSKEWEQHRNPALYRIPIQAIVNLLKEWAERINEVGNSDWRS